VELKGVDGSLAYCLLRSRPCTGPTPVQCLEGHCAAAAATQTNRPVTAAAASATLITSLPLFCPFPPPPPPFLETSIATSCPPVLMPQGPRVPRAAGVDRVWHGADFRDDAGQRLPPVLSGGGGRRHAVAALAADPRRRQQHALCAHQVGRPYRLAMIAGGGWQGLEGGRRRAGTGCGGDWWGWTLSRLASLKPDQAAILAS
jgi:hypothetical protein